MIQSPFEAIIWCSCRVYFIFHALLFISSGLFSTNTSPINFVNFKLVLLKFLTFWKQQRVGSWQQRSLSLKRTSHLTVAHWKVIPGTSETPRIKQKECSVLIQSPITLAHQFLFHFSTLAVTNMSLRSQDLTLFSTHRWDNAEEEGQDIELFTNHSHCCLKRKWNSLDAGEHLHLVSGSCLNLCSSKQGHWVQEQYLHLLLGYPFFISPTQPHTRQSQLDWNIS